MLCKVVLNEHIIQKYGMNKSLNQMKCRNINLVFLLKEKMIPVLTISTTISTHFTNNKVNI